MEEAPESSRQRPPPAKPKNLKYPEGFGYRDETPDRPLLSLNDWYGMGVLCGVTGTNLKNKFEYYRWYCGKAAAANQFLAGIRDGRRIRKLADAPG